jgi:hypothetical protein
MTARLEMQTTVLSELKTRVQQLEQQSNTLRANLDDVMVLLDWAVENKIPVRAIETISVSPADIAATQQWDNVIVPEELARLFLQAHSLAARLKQIVPANEKQAVVESVAETFRQIASRKNLQIPLAMDVTLGD